MTQMNEMLTKSIKYHLRKETTYISDRKYDIKVIIIFNL